MLATKTSQSGAALSIVHRSIYLKKTKNGSSRQVEVALHAFEQGVVLGSVEEGSQALSGHAFVEVLLPRHWLGLEIGLHA